MNYSFFLHVISIALFALTTRDPDTGLKAIDISEETSKYYTILFAFDWIWLPGDIGYATLLNAAKNGENEKFSNESSVQAPTLLNLVKSSLRTLLDRI